ncbi:cytochrome d ubiquinol oxidase subunit I [Silvibacterium bohemicum]|uniref:Cytochrome d ubiquinol oxidase subunit I n=1 Tax=Silvibacterium bohemicum TaxID=1577686 RepID=A0A841JV90_9BACT|nr:cytochrome ubiquinol oxidase subunit I [Silvibacterium bohemicum]MBB6144455.1 cytochrome d ubiquinol oxidase subunit I [Silvibacterium bohemicum]
MDALTLHRLHFAFTITYHYLFPQLTMGLSLLIVVLKTLALRTADHDDSVNYDISSRFWAKIFAINFLLGVVTGIPMEFQFGTNWSEFSRRTGAVIGMPLAMEGIFSFFLESAFLGLFLFGEKRLSRRMHWLSAVLVFVGSWISGFFIIVTNAWMQHPVGYKLLPNGVYEVGSFRELIFNPWAWIEYSHNMCAAVVTASFVMAAVGALYLLQRRDGPYGRIFLKLGVIAGIISCVLQVFPTGDLHGKYTAKHQPTAIAGMEGLFHSEKGAGMILLGQPNYKTQTIDNPLIVNKVLSFLIYGTTAAEVEGLDHFPKDQWPSTLPLLFYSYHIMAGLGTWFGALMAVAAFLLWRGKLYSARWILWPILLSWPLPYIATAAGWMTAEIGRQPWLVYGLIRTAEGSSMHVSASNSLFSLLGFLGMYTVLSLLWIIIVYNHIQAGPSAPKHALHTQSITV